MVTVNELFSGIGAFRKALINLGIEHEIVGISEIDKYAIQSYEAMYGKTMNYGDISKVSSLDYADLWTYGFPCQDVSLAGNKKGIVKGQTRSGLLYEVKRLLLNSVLENNQPKYLIMENVKNLVDKKFMDDFQAWVDWLDTMGYATYWKVMNAADYGIPQRRERVFAISIRKDLQQSFSFPEPIELQHDMAYFLEENPDERFFLKDTTYEYFVNHSEECKQKGWGFRFKPVERESCKIAKTLTTNGLRMDDNYVIERM